jgi:hypothetical protein
MQVPASLSVACWMQLDMGWQAWMSWAAGTKLPAVPAPSVSYGILLFAHRSHSSMHESGSPCLSAESCSCF